MLRATMFIPGCLVLVAFVSAQCANIPTGKLINAAVDFDEGTNEYSSEDASRGRNISPGEQCQDRHPQGIARVCKTDDPASRCSELICADVLRYGRPVPFETAPALDGTWCGEKKICLEGSCIDDAQPVEDALEIIDFEYDCKEWWA